MPTSRFIEKNERLVYVCNVMMLCLAQQLRLPLHLEAKAKKKRLNEMTRRPMESEGSLCVFRWTIIAIRAASNKKFWVSRMMFFLLLHKSTQHTAVKHKFSPEIYTHTR